MPSVDLVSELDMMEVDNAVNMTHKEISNRFDFRGGKSSIEFDKANKTIKLIADDDFKLRSMHQILELKFVKRSLDVRSIKYGDEEQASGNIIRQSAKLQSGIERDMAKKITKKIKDAKLKVNCEIQGDQLRLSGKKIDDLQSCMGVLKETREIDIPLQFTNMKR